MWAMLVARNREYFRDRAAFGWNFLFPFLIVVGFGLMFGGKSFQENKVGVFPCEGTNLVRDDLHLPEAFREAKYVDFVGFPSLEEGLARLRHHKIDMLIEQGAPPYRYWISDSSPRGYLMEKFLIAGLVPEEMSLPIQKQEIQGRDIRYIEWLFPGILGMNMMFSALWGVGYVVVRYRKNGVLRRLKATPLTALEYLTAQMLSRIFLLMFTAVLVWVGCDLLFRFHVEGSYLDLAVVFLAGSLSLTSLGLMLAARGTSEEFTSGVLNFISWPMMFLSEVWFSIEGAPEWIRVASRALPLTHFLAAVRKIMNEGAGLTDVGVHLGVLVLVTVAGLGISAAMFSWNR
jgi:ABC-type multidrug transport system permease subunit